MAVQDDARERQLIELFKLERIPGSGRADTDARLVIGEVHVPFELKSTTSADGSVTTVRDFGAAHIAKWKGKHWLIGCYRQDGVTLKYCLYGSPQRMATWIRDKEEYIRVDSLLADCVPELITLEMLYKILGKKKAYSLKDAKLLHKRQYKQAQYREKMDLEQGYSPERMLDILKDRCRYVIERGATLNNPHIPGSYFAAWERIDENQAKRLRELVAEALEETAAKLQKTAQGLEQNARKMDKAR